MRVEDAERVVEACFPDHHAVLFASCRGAIATTAAVLAPSGSVAIAGNSCMRYPNAVMTAGCRPAYAEVDESGIVPPEGWPPEADLVVVQDTYGFRCPPPPGRLVVRDASLCASGFGCEDGVKMTVTSFEQSKALCAGQGGLALTRDHALADEFRRARDEWPKHGRGTFPLTRDPAQLPERQSVLPGAKNRSRRACALQSCRDRACQWQAVLWS